MQSITFGAHGGSPYQTIMETADSFMNDSKISLSEAHAKASAGEIRRFVEEAAHVTSTRITAGNAAAVAKRAMSCLGAALAAMAVVSATASAGAMWLGSHAGDSESFLIRMVGGALTVAGVAGMVVTAALGVTAVLNTIGSMTEGRAALAVHLPELKKVRERMQVLADKSGTESIKDGATGVVSRIQAIEDSMSLFTP
jgi:hypothetical protein